MKPPPFDYRRADSVEEAIALLAEFGGDAKLLAGGQSLMPMLNFRLLEPSVLIDVARIPGFDKIEAASDGVFLAGGVRHKQTLTSSVLRERTPVAADAMAHVAHAAIRNRGTLGGSLAHADPAAELPMLAILLGAEIAVRSPRGARKIAAEDFFLGPMTTSLEDDEMIVAVRIPNLPQGTGQAFVETARRAGDFALAGAGAALTVRDGRIAQARVTVMGVHDRPLRVLAAEQALEGETYDASVRSAAAEAVRGAVEPMSDLQASAELRRHLAGVMASRALGLAWERAQ